MPTNRHFVPMFVRGEDLGAMYSFESVIVDCLLSEFEHEICNACTRNVMRERQISDPDECQTTHCGEHHIGDMDLHHVRVIGNGFKYDFLCARV